MPSAYSHRVDLVRRLERLDASHQRVVGGGDRDLEGLDGRVRDEAAAHGVHEGVADARGDDALGAEVEEGVGGVQRQPTPAALDEGAQRFLLFGLGAQVAGVGHEYVRGADGVRVRERLADADPDVVVLGQ